VCGWPLHAPPEYPPEVERQLVVVKGMLARQHQVKEHAQLVEITPAILGRAVQDLRGRIPEGRRDFAFLGQDRFVARLTQSQVNDFHFTF
jgi:hypothetical protein